MDAQELARWLRFATKGGIGKCTATRDCVAQNPEDLMFLQDDEIIVLMQISASDGLYLGSCEDVVGKFSGNDVRFHGKLKKAVFTKRPGSLAASASPTPSIRPTTTSPMGSDHDSTTQFGVPRKSNTDSDSSDDAHMRPSEQQPTIEVIQYQETESSSVPRTSNEKVNPPAPAHAIPRREVRSAIYVADIKSTQREPDSPTSEYTKEGDHMPRISATSDGGFGIGLSLLQGLADAEAASPTWSDSEENIQDAFPIPPSHTHRARSGTTSSSHADSVKKASGKSESDPGDQEWDGDDIYDDYRYSRYSLSSKVSRQSRNSLAQSSAWVPPLPDEPRPSLDSISSRNTASPQPPLNTDSSRNGHAPLNIKKNSQATNGRLNSSPQPPDTHGSPNETVMGIASAMRQQIDREIANMTMGTEQDEPRFSMEDGTPRHSIASPVQPVESSSMDTIPPSESSHVSEASMYNEETDPDQGTEEDTPNAAAVRSPTSSVSHSSLFLPHPHAPKPVMRNGQITPRIAAIHAAKSNAPSAGPVEDVSSIPVSMSLLSTLKIAAARARAKTTTFYGATQTDLLSSTGPVPIAFSLEGRPEPSPRLVVDLDRNPLDQPQKTSPVGLGINVPGPSDSPTSPQPIPRANFFPKIATHRPRSRSFSGFTVSTTEVPFPMEKSLEEGSKPTGSFELATYRAEIRGGSPNVGRSTPQSLRSVSPQSQATPPSRAPSGRIQKSTHVPSPLSLPVINGPPSPSPLALSGPPSPFSQPPPPPGNFKGKSLRQISSTGMLRHGSHGDHSPSRSDGQLLSRVSNERREISPSTRPSPLRRSTSNQFDETDRDGRSELATPSLVQHGGSSSSSSPMARSMSVRSKISISALRKPSTAGRPSKDSVDGAFSMSSPVTPNDEEERVQIRDMEFELVKPVLKTGSIRGSEDSLYQRSPDMRTPDRRGESPAFSPISHSRSPNGSSTSDVFASVKTPSAIHAASMEAHRMREQKWVTLMSSVPANQARKSKKVKRLLLEGVPSSVRGKVWGHITDSRARRMEGLFSQLVRKAPSQFIPLVEQDVDRCFPDHPHLRDPRGSLASLILAYTAMVPDIRYRVGLTRIAGHLLLQAPDEDAFWLFVSIMDTHLRGYYHLSNSGQFEVDSSVFQSLLESADPELAKVIFNDYRIRPIDICGPWFSSLFAGILPPEHLYRAWDVLFYEGSIYVFRVALALILLCKRAIMTLPPASTRPETILELITHPPISVLPQDPEAFISHTFTVKLRDDDLRKQRSKRESQWKQQRLNQR